MNRLAVTVIVAPMPKEVSSNSTRIACQFKGKKDQRNLDKICTIDIDYAQAVATPNTPYTQRSACTSAIAKRDRNNPIMAPARVGFWLRQLVDRLSC
ncbi:hypothetical protein IQ273_07805 [Nodosilinea sp. LEGE 07298]|nr:hypothetical protein [Nodosilinea sp. LEGE 07298]